MNALDDLQCRRHGKRLQALLSRAEDEAFFQMIWAIAALQSERVEEASRYLQFPAEAATSDMGSKFAIHKWELETLIAQLLITPKSKMHEGPSRVTNCGLFSAGAEAVNHLRKLENAESAIYLKRLDVRNELHRIAQRTFPWQRGYFNVIEFYRYAYIYCQGECRDYFERTYGVSVNDFSLVAFGLFAAFLDRPLLQRRFSMEPVGISPATFEAALNLLAIPLVQARRAQLELIQKANANSLPTAFQPSLLRRYPIVAFGAKSERLRAALPELIALRTTSGLYYDLISGPGRLRNEATARFERYCAEYIAAMLPGFDVRRSHKYQFRGNSIDAPDIIVRYQGQIVLVIECKATKLTFGAQFAEDPIDEANAAYGQIATGAFQIWRYFSHLRRRMIEGEAVSPDARGMVLTLDTWLDMSAELQDRVVAKATELAAENDPEISSEDRRGVVFCAIQELERTLPRSDEGSILRTLSAAAEKQFAGWHLPSVHEKTSCNLPEPKEFPFKLDDVLPWWQATAELAHQRQSAEPK